MYCPTCGNKVHKAGKVWSGTRKIQRYGCWKCGHTTLRPMAKPPSIPQVIVAEVKQ